MHTLCFVTRARTDGFIPLVCKGEPFPLRKGGCRYKKQWCHGAPGFLREWEAAPTVGFTACSPAQNTHDSLRDQGRPCHSNIQSGFGPAVLTALVPCTLDQVLWSVNMEPPVSNSEHTKKSEATFPECDGGTSFCTAEQSQVDIQAR